MSQNLIRTTALAAFVVACVALLAGIPAASADSPRWQKLGERCIPHSLDRDEIRVDAASGPFDAIKLRVDYRPVRLRGVKVHFTDGTVQHVLLRDRVRRGGETAAIALEGGKRHIKKVVVRYETAGRDSAQAEVELWGRG